MRNVGCPCHAEKFGVAASGARSTTKFATTSASKPNRSSTTMKTSVVTAVVVRRTMAAGVVSSAKLGPSARLINSVIRGMARPWRRVTSRARTSRKARKNGPAPSAGPHPRPARSLGASHSLAY